MNLNYIVGPKTNGANPFKIFESLSDIDVHQLASRLQKMDYQQFLGTAYWFAVSTVVKTNAGMRCQICNSVDRLTVHHRTYDTHGREHLNMIDLVSLCYNCHGLFHGHHSEVGPMVKLVENPPKVHVIRVKGLSIVPHTEAEIGMPEGDFFVLTDDLINACRANGSFTNATLNAFGVYQPLIAGWIMGLIGKKLTRAEYRAALEGRFIYNAKRNDFH